jgi:hypothetical protein
VKKRGRNVVYNNVVRRYIPMGEWNGTALTRAVFPITDKRSAGFAVVAQERQSGKVLAAGDFKL